MCKHIQCRRRHKMQLNMCFNFLVLLTCVDQTDNLPTSKQNAIQHVLTKLLICQRGHKIRVHASGKTNCISTFFDQTLLPARTQRAYQHVQTHSMPAMTQNASQLLRKSVTTCVDDTPSMRKMTQIYLSPRCPCALYFSEDMKSI